MAIGRSRPAPPLRTPDGARLTVTRRNGQGSPLESTAARTRSSGLAHGGVGQADHGEAGQAI